VGGRETGQTKTKTDTKAAPSERARRWHTRPGPQISQDVGGLIDIIYIHFCIDPIGILGLSNISFFLQEGPCQDLMTIMGSPQQDM